jgi:uncharacterized protein (UPF0276 family)
MKTQNKKVSIDGSSKKKGAKSEANKLGSKKKDQKHEDHPKKWKAPKLNNKKEVEFKGHTWYWCGRETGRKCEKWRAHKPSECKGLSLDIGAKDKRKRDSKGSDKGNSFAKKLRVARAYVAKLEQQSADKSDYLSDDNEGSDE